MRFVIYSAFIMALGWAFSGLSALNAKELPYLDPYLGTFTSLEGREVLRTDSLIFYEDMKNSRPLTIELAREFAHVIEDDYLENYFNLFSFRETKPNLPIHFIFTERLSSNKKAEYRYQAFYSSLYNENYGMDVLLINMDGLGEEKLLYFIAHELFHLFSQTNDVVRPLWIEEGLAELWGYLLTGYIPQYQVSKYFEDPSQALEEFNDGSPKYYGNSFLFFYFLKGHYLTEKELPRLLQVSHPKELFNDETWETILCDFSLAKLLNTTYLHPDQHYSLKPIHGQVQVPQGLPTDSDNVRQFSTIYAQGNKENLAHALENFKSISHHWNAEILYVLMPPYRRITITTDASDLRDHIPYVIVLNIYTPKK